MDIALKCYWGGVEKYHSPRYFFQNRGRVDNTQLSVVQRTRSGEGFIEFKGSTFRVPRGYAMLFCHGEESSYGYPSDGEEPYELDFIGFAGTLAAELLRAIQERCGPVIPFSEKSEAFPLYMECMRRMEQQSFRDAFQESTLVYTFFMTLSRETFFSPQERDPLDVANDYMATRYQLPINIGEVAEVVGLSREHFSRRYRERFGRTPGSRLQDLRMKAARGMLSATMAPVEAVARHCGYRDVDSFARAYKRYFEMSPSEVRRKE